MIAAKLHYKKFLESIRKMALGDLYQAVQGLKGLGVILSGGYNPVKKLSPQRMDSISFYRGQLEFSKSFHF